MEKLDVICLGELLIDFVSLDRDSSIAESNGFKKAPGGAPANVAVGVSRLGLYSGFIGKVGNDPFGEYLTNVLIDMQVDTKFLVKDDISRTTLSFVAQKSNGVRDCMFYRNPGADMLLRPDELEASYFEGASVFHFGSISLGAEPSKSATLYAIQCAKENGLLISYDPNLRLSLWSSDDKARKEILEAFHYADIVKISDEEYPFILGVQTPEECADRILSMGPRLVVVTLGPKGCYYSDGKNGGYLPTFDDVKVVETTGAGDAFVAGMLFGIIARLKDNDLNVLSADETFAKILTFSNAAGSIATTKLGAIPSLPNFQEVMDFLDRHVPE